MPDASPTVFNGRYALQRQLARGGMADVFLAHDELLELWSRYENLPERFFVEGELVEAKLEEQPEAIRFD